MGAVGDLTKDFKCSQTRDNPVDANETIFRIEPKSVPGLIRIISSLKSSKNRGALTGLSDFLKPH